MSERVRRHFDDLAADYDRWKERAAYYYSAIKGALAEVVPPGAVVAEVGCGTGDLLASVRPAHGVGIDISPEMVRRAAERHPELTFDTHDILAGPYGEERYPFVLAVDVLEHVTDPRATMRSLAAMLEPGGRAVVITANPRWAPVLEVAERLGLKMPEGDHVWRSQRDIVDAGEAAGLTLESFDRSLIVPKALPLLKRLNEAPALRRLRSRTGLVQRAVFTR